MNQLFSFYIWMICNIISIYYINKYIDKYNAVKLTKDIHRYLTHHATLKS